MSIAQFPSSKSCCSGFSVVCQSQVVKVLDLVTGGDPVNLEELVHRTRVLTKKLRAGWTLVRGVVPAEKVKERRAALRGISGVFAGSRDGAVLNGLCQTLGKHDSVEQEPVFSRLAESIEISPDDFSGSVDELRILLEEERQAWGTIDWSNERRCRKTVGNRLSKSLKRVKKDTRKALKCEEPERWHEWRKAVKQLRYQRELIREWEGKAPTALDKEIRELGTALGKRNDLANLARHASEVKFLSGEERKLLESVIGEREEALLKKCRRLGKGLSRHWK